MSLIHVVGPPMRRVPAPPPDSGSLPYLRPGPLRSDRETRRAIDRIESDPKLVARLLAPGWTDEDEAAWVWAGDRRTFMEYLLMTRPDPGEPWPEKPPPPPAPPRPAYGKFVR